MTIEITQAIINKARALLHRQGGYSPSRQCPLALALRANGHPHAMVHEGCWEDSDGVHRMSPRARAFVAAWDGRDDVQPVTLEV